MKAVAYLQAGLPIDDPAALVDVDLPQPVPGPRDLLVKVHAVSVNPVDTKVRHRAQVTEPRVLGWDAVGTVEAVGEAVTLFKPGEVVYYAGSINRPGSNAQYQLVDERIVARKPASLDDAQAAALPLTAITAWELLFDRLRVPEGQGEGQVLLVTGAAGGVGSILVQLARKLTALTVVGTASRPETQAWVRELGAHHVIDHSQPLAPQLQALGIEQVQHVASLTHTGSYYSQFIELLAPQGQLALIDDLPSLDAMPLKPKSISLHWESMFTRSVFQTPDMQAQHDLLTRVAALIDAGTLRTTFGEHYGTINAANLRRAHALIESGKAKGKLVLEGFD
ncbi:zinc-binding alcohol dehydrogenase family protein [Pseudoxanthomonas winnipegensis]|uniref:Zinc-type alcohol dehydrogenase-like protein n=1 Tax=Pseudoxanthomonas winnipegensis TaxID=2480810 RepID=A0A4Q8LC48_9GAMM|nr:zinc-binding alcohol dehydrogenase family protein [Pseudoxanthomonas winnipegensis]RZZ83773.1 zinc-binding alcohol dehydrogenase family protein [Pseudoxanthomonas winnipegensis]TAA26438.1 zinc-binding alcohol dehydrogenase family protein [Pseudoxanthomonas winnipegensis]TAA42901.1 zinc-binding alcohol dehydrogenase family protein [Pseudoxanthomonas winnipegensis]TBV73814.1 zinc-binding alcohol dehydrogenase family protein [Pseudoxanthomonas winnipegensis]